jgi:hypothetical protein
MHDIISDYLTFFWLDPKETKSQDFIKISCFLRVGLITRHKPHQR